MQLFVRASKCDGYSILKCLPRAPLSEQTDRIITKQQTKVNLPWSDGTKHGQGQNAF